MIRRHEIDRLAALHRQRLRRAEEAVAHQIARCQAARRALENSENDIDAHDAAEAERERRFLEAILRQPVSRQGLNRRENRVLAADTRRNALVEACDAAARTVAREDGLLPALRSAAIERRRDADKLAETASMLMRAAASHAEAAAEAELDDLVAARRREHAPC